MSNKLLSAEQRSLKKMMVTFCIIIGVVTFVLFTLLVFGDSYNRLRAFICSGSINGKIVGIKGADYPAAEVGNYKLLWDDNFIASWLVSIGFKRYDIDVLEWLVLSLSFMCAIELVLFSYFIVVRKVNERTPSQNKKAKFVYICFNCIAILVVIISVFMILVQK